MPLELTACLGEQVLEPLVSIILHSNGGCGDIKTVEDIAAVWTGWHP